MKHFVAFLFWACVLSAQTAITTTTTTSAVDQSNQSIQLASVTGVTSSSYLYIQDVAGLPGEFVRVVRVTSRTATVQRGFGGVQSAHISGATVWVGPLTAFRDSVPSGACDVNTIGFTPWLNISTGLRYSCTSGAWTPMDGGGGGGGGAGYSTVQVEGTSQTQRATLDARAGTGVTITGSDVSGTTTRLTFASDTSVLATRNQVQSGADVLCTGAGTATAATCVLAPTPGSLTTGMVIQFVPVANSTGAMTLDVDGAGGLAASAVQRQDGSAIQASDLIASRQYPLRWSGSAWQMLTPVGGGGGSSTVWQSFTAVSWDGSTYRVLGNDATLPSPVGAVVQSGAPGAHGANMTTGGARLISFSMVTPNTISTITVRPLAALQVNSFGTGTFVLQWRAACVPLGANPESATFSSYTTATSTTTTAGAFASTTHTITPGGTCSAGAQIILQARRDTTVNAADTATDRVILVGVSVGM